MLVVDLRPKASFDGTDDFFEQYRGWDDARFLAEFGGDDAPGKYSGELLRDLRGRRLLKRVFSCPLDEFS
ncbi:MAG: hypothetical protein IH987_12205, partial [Planctomycetes bacterium]|nr:hypothetical protein [Planctomycetota bacterium]